MSDIPDPDEVPEPDPDDPLIHDEYNVPSEEDDDE